MVGYSVSHLIVMPLHSFFASGLALVCQLERLIVIIILILISLSQWITITIRITIKAESTA